MRILVLVLWCFMAISIVFLAAESLRKAHAADPIIAGTGLER